MVNYFLYKIFLILIVNTRSDLLPNPLFDSIHSIIYCIRNENDIYLNETSYK